MARVLLIALVALLTVTAAASGARPVAGKSYLVWHAPRDPSDHGRVANLFNINAQATAFGYSGFAKIPDVETGSPYRGRLHSFLHVGSQCLQGHDSSTLYILDGLRIKPDGSFSAVIRDEQSVTYSGPRTSRSVFHLRGKFGTATTVSGRYSEIRYRVRRHPAQDGHPATTRLIPYCHTGTRSTHYRVHFTGRLQPLQWTIDHTCVECI